jgi:hypothetical protein
VQGREAVQTDMNPHQKVIDPKDSIFCIHIYDKKKCNEPMNSYVNFQKELNSELAWRRSHVIGAAVADDDHISQGTTTE